MSDLSHLIGRIYEGVGDGDAWGDVMLSIVRHSKSRGVLFGIQNSTGHYLAGTVVGFDPRDMVTYMAQYQADDPRMPLMIRYAGQWVDRKSVV